MNTNKRYLLRNFVLNPDKKWKIITAYKTSINIINAFTQFELFIFKWNTIPITQS